MQVSSFRVQRHKPAGKRKKGKAPSRGSPGARCPRRRHQNKQRTTWRAAQTYKYNVPSTQFAVCTITTTHLHITPRHAPSVALSSAPLFPVCHLPPLNNNCPSIHLTPSYPKHITTSARTFQPELPPSGETALTQRSRTHIDTTRASPPYHSRLIIQAFLSSRLF